MKLRLTFLSIAHAAVDLACAALFFGFLSRGDGAWTVMVLYNAFAFLMQLPLGILADKLDRNMLFAGVGCALVAAAFLFVKVPVAAAVIAGLGNGAFHVGGGIEVMNRSGGKAGPLGVFVSPGAIGLYFGKVCGGVFRTWLTPLLPILVAVIGAEIALAGCSGAEIVPNAEFSVKTKRGGGICLALLFLVVVLRSFMGVSAFDTGDAFARLPYELVGFVPVLCLALGKAAGGFVSDLIGARLTGVISLAACALLLFFPVHPAATLAALFLFNMTMPITLHASAKLLPGAKGMSFGLLTAALFVGVTPYFLALPFELTPAVSGALALASLALLLFGLGRERV
ncbi:MAG: hypothetical protein J5586_05115 [Clostridia bacterium]|nr:hypothetical protein [Clostridia bacterium]